MRRLLGPSFAIGILLSASAQAQPAALPLELSWQAPGECPPERSIEAELARIVRARAGRALRPLAANVVIERAANGYRADLHTDHDGQQGERDLHAQDCATLTRSVTLVLALAFGPDAEIEPDAPPETVALSSTEIKATDTPSDGADTPADKAQGTPREPDAREPDEDSALDIGFLLGGGIETGLFPAASAQLQSGVALTLSPLVLVQLRVTALPAVSMTITDDASARFDGLAASALGCARSPWLFSACAGARIAALRARGLDLDVDGSATAPWYALLATIGASWPSTGPLRIGLEAALAISLTRPRFAVKELGTVHRIPLLALELSVLLQLWP